MDILKCEAFLNAVDTGSMTAAAELMGYTQSGITRMIESLEQELGFPLLIRNKKGVRMTENGHLMLPAIREIVKADQKAEQLVAEIKGTVTGTLTIGTYFSISSLILPDILSVFRAKFPGIRIRLLEGGNSEMEKWLRDGTADFCICGRTKDSSMDWIPLIRDEMVAWLPPDHKYAKAPSYPIREMEKEAFIHTVSGNDTDQDRIIEREHLKVNTVFTTKDAFSTYNMVEAGLGMSFNQRLISIKWKGRIAQVPFDPPQYIVMGILLPSLERASPAAIRLINYMKSLEYTI